MAKLIGFFVLIIVLPLGLIALIALLFSLRFHAAAAPCIRQETKAVTIWQGKYVDISVPFATHCVQRYSGK